jgi:hypothetical protein
MRLQLLGSTATASVLRSAFDSDATFGEPNGGLWKGKDKIRKAHDKLFETFDIVAIEFKRLAINFPTPDIAECELSVLSRHCLRKRTPSLRSLINKVSPWTRERNGRQCGVDWQFTTADARIKLKSLYPHIQLS